MRRSASSLFVVAMLFTSVQAAAAVQYRIEPPVTSVSPGQTCTLSVVTGDTGDSLGCVECHVTYDPSLVTLVSGTEGTLFSTSGVQRLFFNHALSPGEYSVEGCLLGYQTFVLSPGEVARFVFRADAPGVCPVRVTLLNLWDIDRNEFAPTVDPNAFIHIGTATDAAPSPSAGVALSVHPSPFSGTATIELRAGAGERASVSVFSVTGRRVRRVFEGPMAADVTRVTWDGRDDSGRKAAPGVYVIAATRGDARVTRKIVLIR